MSYESRLYVIRKTDVLAEGKHKYAETLVEYEMGVFPPFQKLFNDGKHPATEYAPCRGDDCIVKDMYGDPLIEAGIDEILECLDRVITLGGDISRNERVAPLKAMLEEFKKIENSWYRLAILHYGH
jgi:hypothetical protein